MITIAGMKIDQNPADVSVSRFDLTKSERTASGLMDMQVVRAGIRRVDVVWHYMPDAVLKNLLDMLAANKPFFTLRYPDAGEDQTMTAYAGDISTDLWHTVKGIKYWKKVSVPFIER